MRKELGKGETKEMMIERLLRKRVERNERDSLLYADCDGCGSQCGCGGVKEGYQPE